MNLHKMDPNFLLTLDTLLLPFCSELLYTVTNIFNFGLLMSYEIIQAKTSIISTFLQFSLIQEQSELNIHSPKYLHTHYYTIWINFLEILFFEAKSKVLVKFCLFPINFLIIKWHHSFKPYLHFICCSFTSEILLKLWSPSPLPRYYWILLLMSKPARMWSSSIKTEAVWQNLLWW